MSETAYAAAYSDAQCSVIGSALIKRECAMRVINQLSADDFGPSLRRVYEAIRSLAQQGKAIDIVTVVAQMGGSPQDRQIAADAVDRTPTTANLEQYIDIVRKSSQLSQLRAIAIELAGANELEDARGLLAETGKVLASRQSVQGYSMSTLLERFFQRHDGSHRKRFIPWGMDKLDSRLYVESGDFVVLGGYPSDGKTALSLHFAWAQSAEFKVGYFSFETNQDKIFDRISAFLTGIPLSTIKHDSLSDDDWSVMYHAQGDFAAHELEVIPASGWTVTDIRMYAQASGMQVIYLDYLQLVTPEDTRATRFEQVSQISRALHNTSQQTGITVVALSQLSRPPKQTGKMIPTMRDLRESGQIEQDADAIMLLYRLRDDKPDRDLKIEKNKEGAAGVTIPLTLEGDTQRFLPRAVSGDRIRAAQENGGFEALAATEPLPRQWQTQMEGMR